MFLTSKQNSALNLWFGFEMKETPDFLLERPRGCFYVLASGEVPTGNLADTLEVTLRQTLDRALDQALLMSEAGARQLEAVLNRHLPPVWPGESPIGVELVLTASPEWLRVQVPSQFHNRLHRFPFEDGFVVCPVPDCTGTPSLLGTWHGIQVAAGARSFMIEHTCDAGHHWQCVFSEDAQATSVSVVRLKRMPDLKQKIR